MAVTSLFENNNKRGRLEQTQVEKGVRDGNSNSDPLPSGSGVTIRTTEGLTKEEQNSPGPNVANAGKGVRNLFYDVDTQGTFTPGFDNGGFYLNPLTGQPDDNPHQWFKWLTNAELFSGEGGVVNPTEALYGGINWAGNRTGTGDFDAWMGIGGAGPWAGGTSPSDILVGRVGQDWNVADRAAEHDIFKTNAGIMKLAHLQNAPYFDPMSSTNMLKGLEENYERMGPEAALGWQALANAQSLDAYNSFGGNDLLGGINGSDLDRLLGGGGGGGGGASIGGWANKVLNQGTPRLDDMFDEMDRRRDQSISTGTQRIAHDAARLGFRGGFAQGKGGDLITEAITRNEGQQAEIRANMENELQNRYASALNAEGAAGAQLASANASAGASRHNALVGAKAGLLGNIIGERGAAARAAQSAVYDRLNQGLLLRHDSLEGSRGRLGNLFGNRLNALDTRYMSDQDQHLAALTNSEQFRLQGLAGQDASRSNAMEQMMQVFGARDSIDRQRMLDYITLSEEERSIRQDQRSGMFDLSMIPFNTDLQIGTGAAPAPAYRPQQGNNSWLGTLAPSLVQMGANYIGGPGYEPVA